MKRLAAGLLIASLFMVGCGTDKKTEKPKTGEKTATAATAEKAKTT
jgi:hypothetical protein